MGPHRKAATASKAIYLVALISLGVASSTTAASSLKVDWEYELGATAVGSPVLYEPAGAMGRGITEKSSEVHPEHVMALVLIGANDGELYAVHQGNGSLAWSRNFGSRLQARLVLTKVAMRDTDSGAGAGSRRAKEEGRRERDVLLVTAERGDALALDPRTGEKLWGLDLGLALARDPDHSARKKTGEGGSSEVRLVAPPAVLATRGDDGRDSGSGGDLVVFAYYGSNDKVFVVDVSAGTVDAIVQVEEDHGTPMVVVEEAEDPPPDAASEGLSLAERKRKALQKIRERKLQQQKQVKEQGSSMLTPNIEIHAEMTLTPPREAAQHRRLLLVGTTKSGLHAYALDDRVPTALTPLWNYRRTGMIDFQSRPTYCPERDLVLVGGYSTSLHALNGSTGSLIWEFAAPTDVVATAALSPLDGGATVVVGASDLHVYALHTDSGGELWRDRFGYAVQSAPQFDPTDGSFVVTGTTPRKGSADPQQPNRQEDGSAPRVAAYFRDGRRAWDVRTPGLVFGAATRGSPGGQARCSVFFAASDKNLHRAGRCLDQPHDEL